MTYRTILVGTDGSETAERAVGEAARIAAHMDGRLVIVTAYRPMSPEERARLLAELPDEMAWRVTGTAQAEEIVERGRIVAAQRGVEAAGRVVEGEHPSEAILDVAEEESADLIVVGNKGMTGARRFLLGSVPNNVSHHARCDVAIVRTHV